MHSIDSQFFLLSDLRNFSLALGPASFHNPVIQAE